MTKYSKDGKVVFHSNTHSYYLGEKRLEGVTSFISRFKNKFDSDLMAERYAKKHGLIKDEVLAEWKKKGDDSVLQGSFVHSIFENYILKNELTDSGLFPKEQPAIKFIEDYFKTGRLEPVECECIVYDNDIASQIDCIVKNTKGEYFILDWKTNGKIETNSYGKQMLHHYNILPDASFYHYSLQLSIYKHLYKEYQIKDCYIVHIKENDYELIRHQPIEYIYHTSEFNLPK